MKKILIISVIVLMVIVALFENTGEDVPSETEAETTVNKTEETDDKSQSEMTDEDKAEAERKHEEQKEKDEQVAKQKEKEEQAAKEEQKAKQKAEAEAQAVAEQKAEEEAEAQAKAEEAEKLRKENEAKEKAEQEAKEKSEKEDADKENAETIYLQIMRESVGSYVDIQFDKTEKTYVMTPTDQGLIDEISMLPMGIGHEDWGVLVDGMASMSKSGKDLVGEGYTINLVNPLNHENVILWIVDGEVIYNVIDDL